MFARYGEVQEWLNWLAWKASIPQKGVGGSNPFLSAKPKHALPHRGSAKIKKTVQARL